MDVGSVCLDTARTGGLARGICSSQVSRPGRQQGEGGHKRGKKLLPSPHLLQRSLFTHRAFCFAGASSPRGLPEGGAREGKEEV